MKKEKPLMTLSQIKRMLRMRQLSLLLSAGFLALMVVFSFGNHAMDLPWVGAFLVAGACAVLALAGCAGFLLLNKKLADRGL